MTLQLAAVVVQIGDTRNDTEFWWGAALESCHFEAYGGIQLRHLRKTRNYGGGIDLFNGPVPVQQVV